ncbi:MULTISPECIES: transposase [Streptomyces]|uniref:transposase n=1 Tax=Streptomyces TaxID=1883 RepID=UPI001C301A0E|nr:transposase [Streptomyces sp. GbtcB7]
MTLARSHLMRLPDPLRAGDGAETIRAQCERILQELVDAEATARIGATRGEASLSST